jgi:hypothetical protein
LLLLGYGIVALVVGFVLPRLFGWHPFGLHLAGTIFGTHDDVGVAEALGWAAYNLVVYAAIPLIIFRRRYSTTQLNLSSVDRKNDTLVIMVVLVIESVFQYFVAGPEIFDLGARQLAVGAMLTFLLYLAGAVLPAMIFIYAILVPRYLVLTGWLGCQHGDLGWFDIHAAAHLGRLDRLQLPRKHTPVGDLLATDLLRARDDQDVLDCPYRQCLGARMGVPRTRASRAPGHSTHGQNLPRNMINFLTVRRASRR